MSVKTDDSSSQICYSSASIEKLSWLATRVESERARNWASASVSKNFRYNNARPSFKVFNETDIWFIGTPREGYEKRGYSHPFGFLDLHNNQFSVEIWDIFTLVGEKGSWSSCLMGLPERSDPPIARAASSAVAPHSSLSCPLSWPKRFVISSSRDIAISHRFESRQISLILLK